MTVKSLANQKALEQKESNKFQKYKMLNNIKVLFILPAHWGWLREIHWGFQRVQRKAMDNELMSFQRTHIVKRTNYFPFIVSYHDTRLG